MESIYAKDREEWRLWLETHYKNEKEVLLIYYKTHTGKPSISWEDSVD